MNFLKIAGRDIKSIFTNRVIRVSVIAIIIVPLLYSLLYLDAFWDPYSKLEDLPIAVVNLDKGATLDGKNVNYGNDVIDKLKGNSTVGWQFVSEDEANQGLDGSKYYAKFEIESDFSEKVISAKSGTPVQASMKFVCNEKKNFLAAQVNSKVQSALKEQIVSTITDNYVTASFDNLYQVKDGMASAADGSSQINDGVSTLNSNVPTLVDGVSQLKDGSSKLYDGQTQLNTGLTSLNNGAGQLNSGIVQLKDGSVSLYNGLYSLQTGMTSLNNGLGQLNGQVPTLVSGVNSLYAGSTQLSNGALSANSGSKLLARGTQNLTDSYNSLISPTVKALYDGSTQLKEGLDSSKSDIAKLQTGVATLNSSSDQVSKGSADILSGFTSYKSGVDQLITSTTNTTTDIQNVGALVYQASVEKDATKKNNYLTQALATLQKIQTDNSGASKKLSDLNTGGNNLLTGITTFNTSVPTYTQGVKDFASGTNSLISGTNQVSAGVDQLNAGLGSLNTGLTTKFGPGLEQANSGASALNSGLSQISKGAGDLNTGLGTLNSSTPQLANGISALYSGSGQALTGTNQLYSGSSQVVTGLTTASSGASSLYDGSKQALDGSNQLVTGQKQLYDGVNTLYSKVPDLQTGVSKLYDGTKELSSKLGDGSKQLNDGLVNSSADMGSFVSNPVSLLIQPINAVPNYGTGFAPYFMNLSLWIGAIMMFFVIPAKVDEDIKTSNLSKTIGKYISFAVVGVLQAILVGVVVMLLGLRPANVATYFGLLTLYSLVYVAIVQCLITLLGDPGRLLSIVLLILQLTACAGTFPLELVPGFFKVLYPFMPFTYAVEALREACSATYLNHAIVIKDSIILTLIMIAFLAISVKFRTQGLKFQEIMEGRKSQR